MAHTDLSAVFYLPHTAVGNWAMNNSGICLQRRNEHFKSRMLLFSIGNSAKNTLQYWQRSNSPFTILAISLEPSAHIGNSAMNPAQCAMMPVAMLGPVLLHWRLFKAQFSLWKSRHKCCLSLRRDWKQFPNLFLAHSRKLYVVNKRPLTNFIPAIATAVWGSVKYLKGSHRMGDGQIFLKPPRHSL